MPTEDVAYQQRLKIRRTTLGFGVIQVILGLALTALSFTAFVLSESEKIRNACPYWAGFTVFCSGGVGIVAWRHSSALSMGLFTFFSAVCVVLHMIGTILTGEVGGLLKSIILCHHNIISQSCMCCDSIMTCKQNVPSFKFEGVEECSILTGLLKELLYGLCVLNIFGSLVCFIATILGCTSVARQAGRDQPLFRRRLSAPSDSHEQSQYSWLHYPTDLSMLPPYAPPIYRSVDNFQDCGATPYIVPPPVFDPTDLPPPYSSRNASLSSSGFSLYVQSEGRSGLGRSQPDCASREGRSSIVVQEVVSSNSENQFQQRIYSESRGRPRNPVRITSAILTRSGVLEFRSNGSSNRGDRTADQSLNSSQASLQSEARRPLDIIGQRLEGITQCFETNVFQRYEKAEECKEVDESAEKLEPIQSQNINSQNVQCQKYSCKQTAKEIQRHLSNIDLSTEIIRCEDKRDYKKRNTSNKADNLNNNLIPKSKMDEEIVGGWQVNSSSPIDEEPSSNSNSDSGLGDDLSPLCQSINSNSDYKDSDLGRITCIDSRNKGCVDSENYPDQRDYSSFDERSSTNPNIDAYDEKRSCNMKLQAFTMSTAISEDKIVSHNQRNSVRSSLVRAPCNNECGLSKKLFESSVDNDFEGVCWNVFGVKHLNPHSGDDSELFQPVPMMLSKTQSSTGQEHEEFSLHQEWEKSESQRLIDSEEELLGQYINVDATHYKLIPSDANHQQLMPSEGSHASQQQSMPNEPSHHQLMPSDASHQLLLNAACHHQSFLDTKQQDKLVASNKDYQSVSSNANHHQLIPLDVSHQRLIPDPKQDMMLQLDVTHQQLIPSDVEHCQLIPNDAASQQCHQPDYNTMTEDSLTEQEATITGLLLSIDNRSDLCSPYQGFTGLVSEISKRHSPEDAGGVFFMGYSTLGNERSLECCEDEHSEPVFKLESTREKNKTDIEYAVDESGEGSENKSECHFWKTDEETYALNRNNPTFAFPVKQENCIHPEDKRIPAASGNREGDDTEQVIRMMDDFNSSNNVSQIHSNGLPVVQVDTNQEDWERLRLYLEQQTASNTHDTLPRNDLNQLESSMSSGRSSVDCNCDHPPDEILRNSLGTNFSETLSDSGSEQVEQISVNKKCLAQSDTCIAMETNYLALREKIRTSSDPEVKGLGITKAEFHNHRKTRNRGRLLNDTCIGKAPPNIELPVEIRNEGLGYCPDEGEIWNTNIGNGEQRWRQRMAGSVNDLVKNKPKAPSCHHRNKEHPRRSREDLLKKEKALMKTMKLRNEMSRSFLHLNREKKLNPSCKDFEASLSPGSEVSRNALKKRKLVQKVRGDHGNSGFISSVEHLMKGGHHKHSTKQETSTGQNSSGKETFV